MSVSVKNNAKAIYGYDPSLPDLPLTADHLLEVYVEYCTAKRPSSSLKGSTATVRARPSAFAPRNC